MNQPRVFVTQRPRPNKNGWTPDFTPAQKYGALHFVFESEDVPYTMPTQAMAHAEQILKDFDPFKDFLLWPQTGDPAAMWSCLFALAFNEAVSHVTFLYWERARDEHGVRSKSAGFYTPVLFNLS